MGAEPFDLDALATDPDGEPFTFHWNAELFTLQTFKQMEWRQQITFTQMPMEEAMRLLLGEVQWDNFVAKPMSRGRLNALLDAWYLHQGISSGEGPASSDS